MISLTNTIIIGSDFFVNKDVLKKIEGVLKEYLNSNGFKTELKENVLNFANENTTYKIEIDEEKKHINLLLQNGEGQKLLSRWLLDIKSADNVEINDIAQDFLNTLKGQSKSKGKKENKKLSNENGSVNPLFFMNRLATIFPEIKDDIREEKENYESFRGVTFAKEKVLPKVLEVLNNGTPKDKFKKLCSLFNNMYDNGDLDVRGIITIIFLNSLDDSKVREKVANLLSNDLKLAFLAAERLKGKKVKPERPKKKKQGFMAKALDEVSK